MKSTLEPRQRQGLSRRTILKTATGAALGVALGSLAFAEPPSQPIYYGKNTGQTPLDATNVFPLFAAWILVCVGQSGSCHLASEPHVVELATYRLEARFDVAETLSIR
jgi:hypothetical protein